MTQSCHHLHESTNELGASLSCVLVFGLFVLLFGFVFCLVLFCVSLLFAWFMMMTAQRTMYRSFPISLLRPSTADGREPNLQLLLMQCHTVR